MNSRTGVTNSSSADSTLDPNSYSWSDDSRWVLDVGKKYFKVILLILFLISSTARTQESPSEEQKIVEFFVS